jgi:dihydroneopterin aldolase
MMDQLKLHGITAYGYHGALPEEQVTGQLFRANLVISLDTREAGQTDDLGRTLNYAPIVEEVTAILTGKPVRLIETLAEKIAETLLSRYSLIQEIRVEVEKPNPPVAAWFSGVSVCILRKR